MSDDSAKTFCPNFSAALRALVESDKNRTQTQWAAEFVPGMGRQYVSKLLNGRVAVGRQMVVRLIRKLPQRDARKLVIAFLKDETLAIHEQVAHDQNSPSELTVDSERVFGAAADTAIQNLSAPPREPLANLPDPIHANLVRAAKMAESDPVLLEKLGMLLEMFVGSNSRTDLR